MLNMINLFEGLEKLTFEILMWSFFIPKTLIKVLWNPEWAPGYVDDELIKKEARFADYMSPLLLLILIVILLFGLIESIGLNTLEISGTESSMVGETTIFYATPKFRWHGNLIGEVWTISSPTSTDYRLIRYTPNIPNEVDINLFLAKYNQPHEGLVVEVVEGFQYLNPNHFEYTWKEPGVYDIWVVFFSNDGEATGTLQPHQIIVSGDAPNPIQPPQLDGRKQKNLTVFENQERAFSIALIGLIIPIWFSLVGELLKYKPITRKGMRRVLYIHSMYTAPVALVLLFGSLASLYYIRAWDWVIADNHISRVSQEIFAWLTLLNVVWLFIVEVRFFREELNKPIWLITLLTGFLFYIPFQVYVLIENRNIVSYPSIKELLINPQIIWFGLYFILAGLVIFLILTKKVFPYLWRWVTSLLKQNK